MATISTLIPTFRRPTMLRRAIMSAANQEGTDVCVCVFDNCSGDTTPDVVREMGLRNQRINYVCHRNNIGGIANFDFAMRRVETPFFSLLSDDDYLLPGFYQRALAGLASHPEAMFWVGESLSVDTDGKIWMARAQHWPHEGVYYPPEGVLAMLHGRAPPWTSVVFRREVLDRVGFLDLQALGPSDLDFMLRAATLPFLLDKTPSAVFVLNPDSFSATQPLSSFWPGWQQMLRNVVASRALDGEGKVAVLAALHHDARRMLFRRGANALAAERYDFVRGAARALRADCGSWLSAGALRGLVALCASIPMLQHIYTAAYRYAERRVVASRDILEARFGYLIQRSVDE